MPKTSIAPGKKGKSNALKSWAQSVQLAIQRGLKSTSNQKNRLFLRFNHLQRIFCQPKFSAFANVSSWPSISV